MCHANLISLSIAPVNVIVGKRYDDLISSIGLMKEICSRNVLDGFELQLLEEWDACNPPKDERGRRLPAWRDSVKYSSKDIAALIKEAGVPILTVHAKRDIGIDLCSGNADDVKEGRRLAEEALRFAEVIGARVCVFHLWDTWKEKIDLPLLSDTLAEISLGFPTVRASVENVPTHLPGHTPLDLAKRFPWITLDLQWAALYHEFDGFEKVKDRIVNVHLRGELEQAVWTLKNSPFGFYEALEKIRTQWGYQGVLTMEPNGLREGQLERLIAAMRSIV